MPILTALGIYLLVGAIIAAIALHQLERKEGNRLEDPDEDLPMVTKRTVYTTGALAFTLFWLPFYAYIWGSALLGRKTIFEKEDA